MEVNQSIKINLIGCDTIVNSPSCALIPDDFLDGLHCVTVVDCTFMPPTPDV